MTNTVIDVKNLSKSYNGNTVLKDVSFDLSAGELVLLTGPNGSGKTTLFHLLAGLRRSDSGRMAVNGRPVEYLGRTRRDVALLPQDLGFHSAMTVEQISSFYGGLRELSESTREHWLEKVDLLDSRNERISALSGGMKQRLGLHTVMGADTPVVLLDEPANRLDPDWQTWVADTVLEQVNGDRTVVVTTHRLSLWEPRASMRMHLDQGSVTPRGNPDENGAEHDSATREVTFQ